MMIDGANYLFLDTEWADAQGTQLVSLALVGADERLQFYAERDPLPSLATEFVKKSVYPLLERGITALTDEVFSHQLGQFLASVSTPKVLFDHPNDGKLLSVAMAGFGVASSEVAPALLELVLVDDGLVGLLLEDWFAANPEAASRRHHARVDAEALRMAWLAANRYVEPDWSPSARQLKG